MHCSMGHLNFICLELDKVPSQEGWLDAQPVPVIAVGDGICENADVVVSKQQDADRIVAAIETRSLASLALVQVLRMVEKLPVQQALTIESLAYAALQAGVEHRAWLESRAESPSLVCAEEGWGDAVSVERVDNVVYACLNRPKFRNSVSVEVRDALVSLFELLVLDDSIERLELRAEGKCFSVGGELREFGLSRNPATAHWVRTVHNPGRLLAQIAPRVHCLVHGACIGSGIELPAFADYVTAHENSFFQLPELELGLIPGAGGCISISRRIGRQQTAWMVLTGRKVNARKALAWGLIDKIESGRD